MYYMYSQIADQNLTLCHRNPVAQRRNTGLLRTAVIRHDLVAKHTPNAIEVNVVKMG